MKLKLFCILFCMGIFCSCEKEVNEPEIPIEPPVNKPEPIPSTDRILKFKIGDINMVIGSQNWNYITYGNGKYVAVGEAGWVTYSTNNGESWASPKQIGDKGSLYSITFGNGRFITSNSSGQILYSPDAVTWSIAHTMSYGGGAVGFGGGKFVAFDTGKNVYLSLDEINWSKVGTTSYQINDICYTGNRFIAVGNSHIFISTNASTWEDKGSVAKNYLYGIAYDNDKVVGVGNSGGIIYSLDGGNTFVSKTYLSKRYNAVAGKNGMFIAISADGTIIYSTDLINWKSNYSNKIGLNSICII